MLALKLWKKEKDQHVKKDLEKIAGSLRDHPKTDLTKKKNGKTLESMIKSSKIFTQKEKHVGYLNKEVE